MAAPREKTADGLLRRRARVAELYCAGHRSMAAIGLELGVSANTIFHDMRWCREQWRTRASDAIDKHKAEQLARIDQLEVEAWRAWRKSQGEHIKVTTKHGTRKPKQPAAGAAGGSDQAPGAPAAEPFTESTTTSERLAGDPRFLDIIADCVRQRREILGLDAPKKTAVTDPSGQGPATFVIEGCAGAIWLPKA